MNKWIIILLFCLFNLFFGTAYELKLISVIAIIIYGLFSATKVTSIYKKVFILFFIGIIGATISCKVYRGQSFFDSIKAMQFYYGILFYFILKANKVNLKTVEDALLILICVLDILYISQYYLLPYGYNFLSIDDWMIGEGTEMGGTRLRVMSSGLYLVGLMYGLSKWYITKEVKYLPLFFLGVFIMLLAGYRQFVASLFVTIIYMFYAIDRKINSKQIKYLILLGVIAIVILTIPAVQEKISGMLERNATGQNLGDSDYIRVVQFDFFTKEYFSNPIEFFFGSGIPYGSSHFGKWFDSLTASGIQYVDWGILGMSWVLGIPTAAAIIWMFIKGIRLKVDLQYKYLGMYLFFLLTTCITNWEMFRNGNFLVHSMVLYIIEQAHYKFIQMKANPISKRI